MVPFFLFLLLVFTPASFVLIQLLLSAVLFTAVADIALCSTFRTSLWHQRAGSWKCEFLHSLSLCGDQRSLYMSTVGIYFLQVALIWSSKIVSGTTEKSVWKLKVGVGQSSNVLWLHADAMSYLDFPYQAQVCNGLGGGSKSKTTLTLLAFFCMNWPVCDVSFVCLLLLRVASFRFVTLAVHRLRLIATSWRCCRREAVLLQPSPRTRIS